MRLGWSADGRATLEVWVVPGASRDRVAGLREGALKVQVSAPPEGGKANERTRAVLARTLGLRKRQVRLAAGSTSRAKTFEIEGVTPDQVRLRIAALGLEEGR